MKKHFVRSLSVVLAVILLTQVAPLGGMFTASAASAPQLSDVPSAPDATQEPLRHINEEVSLRTADSKVFNNEDGSGTAYVYPQNIHFADENGDWQEYDNTLVRQGDFYTPKASDFDISLPNVLGGSKAVTMNYDQFGFALGVPEANAEAIVPDLDELQTLVLQDILKDVDLSEATEEDFDLNSFPVEFLNQQMSAARNLESVIYYPNAFPGAHLEYTVLPEQIKENIYVMEKQDKYIYSYTLDLQNLVSVQKDERTIELFDSQSGDLKLKIKAPFAVDANGETNTQAITLTLDKNSLTVTADSDWMNAPERVFPVTLDPTYQFSVNENTMANVSVNNKIGRSGDLSFKLNVGGRKGFTGLLNNTGAENLNRTFLRFETPELPNDSVVTNATLMLDDNATPAWAKLLYWLVDFLGPDYATLPMDIWYYFMGQETRDYTVNVRAEMVLEEWIDDLTFWSNQPKTTGVALAIGNDDPEMPDRSWWRGKGLQGLHTFDITDAVKHWISVGSNENYGIMLKAEDETKFNENFLQFASLSYQGEIDMQDVNKAINAIISGVLSGIELAIAATEAGANFFIPDFLKQMIQFKIPNIPIHVNRMDSEPIVSIQYVSVTGLEDYFSYETVEMGRSGAAYINHYNGALTYVQPVAQMSGERMPVGASMVYNSNHERSSGTQWNMKLGVGFRTSLFEQISPINNYEPFNLADDLKIEAIDRIGNLLQGMHLAAWLYDIIIEALGTPRQYYTLIDGDGTEHCFVQNEDRQKRDEFLSEVNKKLILRRMPLSQDGYQFVLEDEYGNQKVYTDSRFVEPGLIEPDELDEWKNFGRRYYYLNTIRDANGNETNIFYETRVGNANYGRIMKVVDTIGREFNFAYDGDGYLTKITDQIGRTTQFSYNKNDHYVPVLDQIIYHDGQTTQFQYIDKQDKNQAARNRTQLKAVTNPDKHNFAFGLAPVNTRRRTSYRVNEIQHGINGSYTRVDNPDKTTPGIVWASKDGNLWQRIFYWISKTVYDIVWNAILRPSWFLIDDNGRWYFLFREPDDPIYGEDDYDLAYTPGKDVSTTWLEYENSRTTVVSSLGEAAGVTYAFDRIGRAVGARDNTTGENAFVMYTQSDGVKNLPGFAAGAAVVRNLLDAPKNGTGVYGVYIYAQDAFAGKESWAVTAGNALKFGTTTKLERGKTYTLSLFAKQAPASNAKLMITCGDDATQKELTNEWERYIVTFENDNNKKIEVSIEALGGDILVDAVQLEKNNAASPYNYLENSYFANKSAAKWSLGAKIGDTKSELTPKFDSDGYLLIEGSPNKEIALEQKIPLNKDDIGKMLLFGAAASIVSVRDEDEKARVSVEFFKENGEAIVLKEKEDDEEDRVRFLDWIKKWLKGENPPWPDEWRQIRPVKEDDDKITNVDGSHVFANFNRDIRPAFEINKGSNKWYDFFNRKDKEPSITDTEKGIQTVATAYVIPEQADYAMFYISYDAQAGGTRNAMHVQEAFAYIGAGGTIFDYMGGKLQKVVSGGGIAEYTWEKNGPNLEKVEITKPRTKKENDADENNELNPRREQIDYKYDSRNNVTSMTESRDDGNGNYLVTKTTYDYKTTKTSTYVRDSRFLNLNLSNDASVQKNVDIGGILLGSTVMTFTFEGPEDAEKTPAPGVVPLASQQTVEYINDCNDVKKVSDSSTGQWAEYSYLSRENNIPTEVKASDESRATYEYNKNAPDPSKIAFDVLTNIKAYDDAKAYENEYQYTGFGAGQTNTVSGLLDSIKRNGTEYAFQYDVFGQAESVKIGGQTLVTNKYFGEDAEKNDASGKTRRFALEETSYANGAKYTPEYDERGRVVAERWNGASKTSTEYIYDNRSVLSLVKDNDAKQNSQFDYDLQGRLTGVNVTSNAAATIGSSKVRLGYRNEGELEDFRLLVNGSQLSRVKYAYDAFDRPWQTTLTSMGADRGLQYNYNAETGRLTGTTLKLDGADNYAFTQFSYDDKSTNINGQSALLAGNVTELTNALPGEVTTFGYTYKPGSGNIETISVNGAEQHRYTYDKIGQLTSDNGTTYTYDMGGNLTHINGVERFKYGQNTTWKDQLTEFDGKTLAYDAIGNLDEYDGSKYIWEKARQLTKIEGTVNAQYTYDYTGLRSSKTVGGVTTNYIWAGGLIMAQVGSDGNTIAWSYDAGGSMLGFTLNGTPYFYLRNLQGDVVGIYDANGAVVAKYEYDAWGNITVQLGALSYINPIRYRGYYYDVETGYYYCQSRYYNPQWCRWISADVYMDTQDGILGTNMYAYCQNEPVGLVDPSGYWVETALDIASLALSIGEFAADPSWFNAGMIGLDIVGIVVPVLPSAAMSAPIKAVAKVATKADDVVDVVKVASKADDVVDVVKAASKADDVLDAAKAVSKADDVLDVTKIPAKAPDFVVTPRGEAIPIPKGATGPINVINPAGNTTGFAFTGGSGGLGLNPRVTGVRIMDPTLPIGRSPGFPNGYVKFQNIAGQGVIPFTGQTASRAMTHFPLR
jgi:RHS repeat-associated protein